MFLAFQVEDKESAGKLGMKQQFYDDFYIPEWSERLTL
jgi:hypothetical protein